VRLIRVVRIFYDAASLRSPFVKGDLGGFSNASKIPPDPPFSTFTRKNRSI
jgi:hypothetical protein